MTHRLIARNSASVSSFRVLVWIAVLAFVLGFRAEAQQDNIWLGGTTAWTTTTNWSLGVVPTNAHNVRIPRRTNSPLLSGASVARTITFVDSLAGTATLSVNSRALTVGTAGFPGNIVLNNTGTITITTGSITLSNGGNLKINSGGTITHTGASTITVGGTLTQNGGTYTAGTGTMSFNGAGVDSIIVNSGTLAFNNLTIAKTSAATDTLDLTVNVTVAGNLTVTSGVFDLGSFTANRTAAGGTLSVAAGAAMRIGGTNVYPTNYTTNTLNATSTVEYYGSNQPVSNTPTYGNLLLSGSGSTKSTPAGATTTTVGGSLTVSSGVTYAAAAGATPTLTLQGTTNTVTGTLGTAGNPITTLNVGNGNGDGLTIASTGALNAGTVAIGAFTITVTNNGTANITGNLTGGVAGATWVNAANSALSASGTVLTTGTLTATASPNTVDYNGTGAQTVKAASYNNLTVSGARTTNSVTIAGAVNVAGTFTPSATYSSGAYIVTGSTFAYNGTGAQTVEVFNYNNLTVSGARTTNNVTWATSGDIGVAGTLSVTATFTSGSNVSTNSTINYNNAGTQNIAATTATFQYYNLTLSNTSLKTAAGNMTVNGDLTMNGSASFSGGTSRTHTFNGNWVVNTSAATPYTFTTANTVNFNGSAPTSLDGTTSATLTFNSINVNNTNGFSLNKSISFSTGTTPTLTVAASVTLTPAAGITLTSTGTLTGSGTVKVTASTDFLTQYNITTKTLTALTVDYDATTAQTVNALNYFNLIIQGSRTTNSVTLANGGTIGVSGTFTPSASFSSGGYAVTANTFNYNGTGAQTVQVFNYNNLTVSGAHTTNSITWASGGDIGVAGTLTVSATFTSGSNVTTNSTVNYNAAGVQSVIATTATFQYYDLTFSNTSLKTAAGNMTVNGDLTISDAASFSGGTSRTHTFNGNWVVNTSAVTPFTFTTASTANFNMPGSPAATSIGGTSAATLTFNTINFNNTSGVGLNENASVSGTATVASSVILTPAAAVIFSGTGTLTGSGTVKVTRTAATPDFATQYSMTTKTLTALTVDYDATGAQSVNALNYFNLIIQGSRTTNNVTLANGGTIGVSGTFTPSASFSSGVYIITGNTINFNGAIAQTIPAFNYNNLTSSSTGGRTLASSGTTGVAGALTPGTNAYTITGSTFDFNGSGSQTIPTLPSTNYNNLTHSGSGTGTLGANVGVVSDLTVSGGILDLAAFTANRTASGGTLNVGVGATLRISGSSGGLTGSNFPSNYAANTLGGAVEFYGAGSQTIPALNFTDLTSSSTGARVLAGSGTIGVSGIFTPGTNSYTITGSTMDFNAAGNQSVAVFNYNNLSLSTSGVKTFATGSVGVAGTFTLGGTATADAISNPSTIDYNGSSTQTILAINYTNLTLSNGGTKTFPAATTGIAGSLTITGATADATTNNSVIDFNGGGAQTVPAINYRSLTFSTGGTKTLSSGTTRIFTTFTVSAPATADALTNSTTVEFNGTANQNSPTITYYNLVVNSTGTRVLLTGVTVNNDFTVLAGRGQVAGANFTVTGTSTIATEFRVTATGGVKTFGNIVVQTGGLINFTANENLAINGNLQVDGTGSITSGTGLWTFQKLGGGGTLSGTAASVSVTNVAFTTDYANSSPHSFGGMDVSGATFTNNSSVTVSASLTGSGTLVQGSSSSLDLTFTGASSLSTLTASASANTVNYSASGNQTLLLADYANLSLSGSGIKTVPSGTTRISQAFTMVTATLDAISNATGIEYNGSGAQNILVADYYHLTLSTSGTKSFLSGTTRIAGTFSISGSASANATSNNPTVEYNGSSPQTAPLVASYYGLTINNVSGLTIGTDVTVTNLLTLTSGNITTGANKVSIVSTASVSRTSGHIIGKLEKYIATGSPTPAFEIGDATAFTPVNLSFASVSVAGTFIASTTTGDHPQILTSIIDASKSVNRYWTLTNNGVTFTTYDVTFNFVSGDVDGSANTANFILDRYKGATWTPPTVGTLTSTSSQATSLTSDGDFQIGELSVYLLKTWDGGALTNNWGDAANWNPDGVPAATNNVSLTGANSININVAAVANSVTLNNSSLIVTILSGNSLTASGDLQIVNGTLNTQTTFPSVSGTVNITGGTVGYTNTGPQTISAQSYNYLNLNGSGTKTFAAGATGIAGDMTFGGSATANATTNSTSINYSGGGSQLVGAINYYDLILSNAGTKTFSAGTVGIANSFSVTGTASANATANSTTVDYNGGSAQGVAAINYYNLTLSGAGTKTLVAGTAGIANAISITGSALLDATANATTVDYNGGSGQSVAAVNYNNLSLSNAGVKTFASGTVGITGNLAVSGSASANATTNSTTVDYDGSGGQNVGNINYYNLTLSNAGTKTFVAGTTGIAGSLSIAGAAAGDAISNATTIDYNGGAQTVGQINYNNLTFSNTGAKQFAAGSTNITGDLTVTGSASVDATTNTTTIVFNGSGSQIVPAADYGGLTFSTGGTKTLQAGTTRISGVFTVSGATANLTSNNTTVEFNGSATQVAPAITFYNLVSNNTGTRLDVNNVTVNNDITVQQGTMRTTGNSLTVVGTTTLNGQWLVTNVNGAKTVGNVVVNTSGSISFTANEDLTINGDFQVNGSGSVTSGIGLWAFQKGGGGTLSGSASSVSITNATFTTAYSNSGSYSFDNLTITGTTYTNNGTTTVTNGLTGTGTFTQGSGGMLNYNATANITVTGFNASALSNSVEYGASGAQSIVVTDYHHLVLSGSNTKTFGSGTTRVAGTFNVIGGATADATMNSPTIEFNGSSLQTVHGISYYNMKVNNAAGLTLGASVIVVNQLTLTSGTVTTGTDSVTIGSSGTVSRASGHIVGNLVKTIGTGSPTVNFEIGDGSGNYAPVTIAFTAVTVSGALTVSTTTGDHPQILTSGIEPSKTANRYWTLGGPGISYTSYNITVNFVAGDLDGAANTAAFIVGRYQGGTWYLPAVGTLTSTSSEATGVVGFGDFQVGEQATAVLKTWDGGASTNNWGDANNWNPNGVPSSSNNVNLTGANTINVNVAATVNSITFNNNSLVVTIQSGNSLAVAGDLQLVSGTVNTEVTFPNVTGTVSITGGTVGYTNTGAQSISAQNYHHLTLGGSGLKTFAGSTGIAGDLTVSGASADATTNNTTIDYNGNGSQAVGAINYYDLTLSNAGTKTFASGTVGIAHTFSITGSAAANATSNSATVNYDGGSAQSVQAIGYYHLTFSNAGLKTFAAGTTTIAGDFSFGGTATANATSNNTTIDYDGSGIQVVGAFDYTTLTFSNTGTKTFSAGTAKISGDFTITGSAVGNASTNNTSIEFNGVSPQNIAAASYYDLTLSNGSAKTLAAGTTSIANTFTLTGGATLDAVGNGTTINFNGAGQTVPAISYYNLTFSGSGTKTLSPDTTAICSNLTVNAGTVDAIANSSTVEFTGTLLQSSSPVTFYNLLIFKVSNRLVLDNLTVNHDFTVRAGEGRLQGGTFTVGGTTTLSEIFRVSSAAATPTLNDIVVNNTGTLNFSASAVMTVNGSLQVDGGATLNSGTGLWTFQKPGGGGTLAGTAASVTISNAAFTTNYANNLTMSIGSLTVTGSALTNNQSLTVTSSLDGSGSIVQGSSSTLTLNFNGTPTIAGLNASASGNAVNYTSAGGQSVLAANYYDLTLGTSGTKSFAAGTIGISNVLTISGSASVDATSTVNTVDFNGTGAQVIPAVNFDNLTISGSRTVNSVTLANGGTIGVAGAFTPVATFSSGGFITTNNTVNFSGVVAQSIPAFSYNNLWVSGADTAVYKSASGPLNVGGALTVNANGTLDMGANSFAMLSSGSVNPAGKIRWATSNTYIAGTGTTEFYGSSPATVAPGSNYGNMIFSGSGTITISGAVTATGGTAAMGVTVDNNLTVAPGGTLTITGMELNCNGAITNNGLITVQ